MLDIQEDVGLNYMFFEKLMLERANTMKDMMNKTQPYTNYEEVIIIQEGQTA